MEMIDYEEPTSWEDKGMDWNVPDPRNADYAMAIRAAIMERCAAAHCSLPREVMRLSPKKTVSISDLAGVVRAISTIACYFFNKDFADYEDDYSDFPKMWSYRDLIQDEGCALCAFAKTGDLCENGGAWLKAIKNAIDRLTIIPCKTAWGTARKRSGSRHDPPFEESIGDAFEMAFDDEKGLSQEAFTKVPSTIYAWSGNTHWRCPLPDREDDEDNVDGYCGYAKSVAYTFRKVRSWVLGRELNFLAYALIAAPTGPVAYSQELATSVFDAGESKFKRGMNVTKEHVEDPSDMDFTYGALDSIPKNEVVPTSDFDEQATPILRRSAKRGYEGETWFFLDYGCENGFRFRAKEV